MPAREEIDFRPITHITVDAIGQPGNRVFYVQGWQGERNITLIVEKVQIQLLAVGLEKFLAEIQEKSPALPPAPADYVEEEMHIGLPVDPLFRVGELGLGYDTDQDLVILIARELLEEDADPQQAREVRFWCTRSQMRAMCRWGLELVSRGRPNCPQCGEPMDPEGHFCPRKNGHKKPGQ
ncbi:MAG: DUF3090 domain-containing protein [Chloroflexi bacterium]|nr:DUF3090 domain-containing protein [Chloroflexota bacterium]